MESRLKILVVDPEKSERDLLQTALGEMGLDPVCLANGQEAAERIEVEKFDGIFLDWNLPGLTGKRLIRRIRNSPSNSKVPLGVLAGKKFTREVAQARQQGVAFLLTKPFDPAGLRLLLEASKSAMEEEQRRYRRTPLTAAIVCEWKEGRAIGQSIDISSTGMLMQLFPCPKPGARVQVSFLIPAFDGEFQLEGTVAREAGKDIVAVQFDDLTLDNLDTLLLFYTGRSEEEMQAAREKLAAAVQTQTPSEPVAEQSPPPAPAITVPVPQPSPPVASTAPAPTSEPAPQLPVAPKADQGPQVNVAAEFSSSAPKAEARPQVNVAAEFSSSVPSAEPVSPVSEVVVPIEFSAPGPESKPVQQTKPAPPVVEEAPPVSPPAPVEAKQEAPATPEPVKTAAPVQPPAEPAAAAQTETPEPAKPAAEKKTDQKKQAVSPAPPPPASVPREAKTTSVPLHSKPKGLVNVLVVGEQEQMRTLIGMMLERRGWRIDIAASESEGLEKLIETGWHLVVVDTEEKRLEGPLFEVLQELNLADEELQVLFITSPSMEESEQSRLEQLGLANLSKPIRLHDLLELISELLIQSGAIKRPLRELDDSGSAENESDGPAESGFEEYKMFVSRDDYYYFDEDYLDEEEKKKKEKEKEKENDNVSGSRGFY